MATETTFNSPLETGMRSLNVLLEAYPATYDLQKLVIFDHLVVHTKDVGGPESLHPKLPQSNTEILVRRKVVENGLLLMMSRNLIERVINSDGISYRAGELATTFINSLNAPYLTQLRESASWVVGNFGQFEDTKLREVVHTFFDKWIEEFQEVQKRLKA